jgi:histone-lysine N-methyltransferase SETMAR
MESMQWKHKTSPTPKKFRVEKSAGKVMATVFWDEKGLLLLEFMPQKTTTTGQTYANPITALREAIKEKRRRGKLSAGVLLLHDNAPVHMSAKSQAAIRQCGFQQLNHLPYSPDLAPSDYFLFRVMKKSLRGKRFSSDEEVEAVTTWFEEQPKDFFSRGIKSLQQNWAKCIELLGDYIEK